MSVRLIQGWIAACITLVIPFGMLDPFWNPKVLIYVAGAFWLLATPSDSAFDAPLTWLMRYIGVLFAWYLLAPFVFVRPDATGNGARILVEHWRFIPSLCGILSLLLIQKLQSLSQMDWVKIAWTLCVLALITSLFGALQYFGIYQFVIPASPGTPASRMGAFMGNQMLVAGFLAITLPLFLMFRRWWLAGILCLMVILMTENRAALLAMPLGLAVFLAMQGKRLVPILLLLSMLAISSYIFSRGVDDGGRASFISQALLYWKSHNSPYLGYGLGSIAHTFSVSGGNALPPAFASTHNEWVDGLFEIGVIGMGIVCWLAIYIIRLLFRARPNIVLSAYASSLMSAVIISQFSFPLKMVSLLLPVILAVSACLSLAKGGTHEVPA